MSRQWSGQSQSAVRSSSNWSVWMAPISRRMRTFLRVTPGWVASCRGWLVLAFSRRVRRSTTLARLLVITPLHRKSYRYGSILMSGSTTGCHPLTSVVSRSPMTLSARPSTQTPEIAPHRPKGSRGRAGFLASERHRCSKYASASTRPVLTGI